MGKLYISGITDNILTLNSNVITFILSEIKREDIKKMVSIEKKCFVTNKLICGGHVKL